MTSQERAFHEFAEFASSLKGRERSEAQLFLLRLLEAFGHEPADLPEGCSFELGVRWGGRTKFADLVWRGRVLIEMKSRGAKLAGVRLLAEFGASPPTICDIVQL